jgi:hypothetical protein
MKKSKNIEKICGNCLLYNHKNKECKVAVLIEGVEYHVPVSPQDKCRMEELNIPIEQVRWWVEDENGNQTNQNGTVKVEYPKNFFGTGSNIKNS